MKTILEMINMKICSKCKIEKEFEAFSKNKGRSNGINSECKSCYGLRRAINRLKNSVNAPTRKTKICYGKLCGGLEKEIEEFFNDKNSSDGLRSMCKNCKRYEDRQWTQKNKEKEDRRKKQWKLDNKEISRESNRKSRLKNRESINIYEKLKRQTDILYKLKKNIRSRLYAAIINNYKAGSAIRDLGCSIEEFKKYIEKQFYDNPKTGEKMTWDNWSRKGWHLDHNFPLSEVNLEDRKEFLKVVHYTNISPLWAEENISKSNKVSNL